MTAPQSRSRQPKQLDAGMFQAEISSFALRLAAEGKAAKTIRTYTEAVRWFAATHLPGQADRASWEQVGSQDIQRWMAWLLDRYSTAYASNQYRALQQFFKWLAAEDELPNPMEGLQPPRVTDKLVPVFTGEELTRLERACAGRSFAQRRDHRGVRGDRHPAVRAGRPAVRWRRPVAAGDHRPRQGRQGPDRQDRPPGGPEPAPVPPGPVPARTGLAAPAVARGR
jgi:integrase